MESTWCPPRQVFVIENTALLFLRPFAPQWYPPPLRPLISLASAWTSGSSRLAHPAARTAMTHSPPKLLTGCLYNIRCPNLGCVLISELIDSLCRSKILLDSSFSGTDFLDAQPQIIISPRTSSPNPSGWQHVGRSPLKFFRKATRVLAPLTWEQSAEVTVSPQVSKEELRKH